MAISWEKLGLRQALADGLKQAQSAIKSDSRFLAPSFPGMIGTGDCRLLETAPGDSAAEGDQRSRDLVVAQSPALLFALEGECDMRIGVGPAVRRFAPGLPPQVHGYITTLYGGQFLLLPADFPRADSSSNSHWERPDIENAASALLWLFVNPAGCFAHFCRARGHEHVQTKSIYVPSSNAVHLVGDLQTEVLRCREGWKTAAGHYLQLVLLCLQRELSGAQVEIGAVPDYKVGTDAAAKLTDYSEPPPTILQHACEFIEQRLHEPLHMAQIAAASGVSLPRLNRIFRERLGATPAQYLITRRLERASTLLRDTNLPVGQIALQTGFAHQEHFSRTFSRQIGLSPRAFRRRYQVI
jgi:AraC-like DNA-binding protein